MIMLRPGLVKELKGTRTASFASAAPQDIQATRAAPGHGRAPCETQKIRASRE
jgi:hypothetical protein